MRHWLCVCFFMLGPGGVRTGISVALIAVPMGNWRLEWSFPNRGEGVLDPRIWKSKTNKG